MVIIRETISLNLYTETKFEPVCLNIDTLVYEVVWLHYTFYILY